MSVASKAYDFVLNMIKYNENINSNKSIKFYMSIKWYVNKIWNTMKYDIIIHACDIKCFIDFTC